MGVSPIRNYNPLYYDALNLMGNSVAPSGVYTSNDMTTLYYQRMLYQRVSSVFDTNLPPTWSREYLLYVLMGAGFAVVLDSDRYARKREDMCGVIPQYGTCYGYNVYYLPRSVNVASPLINAQGLTIGKDCEIINLTPDWRGIYDIIHTYAELLAQCNQAAVMSLQNSKIAKVFAAHNRSEAQILKGMVDRVNSGQTAVILGEQFLRKSAKTGGAEVEPLAIFQQDTVNSWVSDRALADYTTVLDRFDEEIGIPSLSGAAATKQERVTNEEVHRNDIATQARIVTWMECIDASIARVKRLFPDIDVSIKYRYADDTMTGGAADNE